METATREAPQAIDLRVAATNTLHALEHHTETPEGQLRMVQSLVAEVPALARTLYPMLVGTRFEHTVPEAHRVRTPEAVVTTETEEASGPRKVVEFFRHAQGVRRSAVQAVLEQQVEE